MTPQQYFQNHPEQRGEVMRAWYAYHAPHFRLTTDGHNFTNALRTTPCVWCGRSREQVRWDDQPPQCAARPVLPDIAETLHDEERRALALTLRAHAEIGKVKATRGINGASLVYLHQTHGITPEDVETFTDVSDAAYSDYQREMAALRQESRKGRRVEVVCAKIQ